MTAVQERPVVTPAGAARGPLTGRRMLLAWWGVSASVLTLFVVAFALVLSGSQEHSEQKRLYSQFREQLAAGTAPLGGIVEPGRPVALLTVPRLRLDVVVVEGTAGSDLRAGPGHRRDTVLPGQEGVSVLYGRAVTYGGPFSHLSSLHTGDVITAVTSQGTFRYAVERTRRPGDPLPTPLAAGAGRLVLGSVEGDGWRSGWAPKYQVYVDAALTGKGQPTQSGRLSAVTDAEQIAGHDRTGLILVVLWLQLLVVVVIATAWATVRWGLCQAWLAGMPAVLAVLWATTNAVLPLLPNVL